MSTRFKATTTSAGVVAMATAATTVLGVVAYYYTYTYCKKPRPPKKDEHATAPASTCTTAVVVSPQDTLDLIRHRRSIFPKHYSSGDDKRVPAQVLDDMLEAATWAPSHHLTEPWHFIVFWNDLPALGQFLAEQYKATTTTTTTTAAADAADAGKHPFVQAKYDKKIQNCVRASFVIGILCTLDGSGSTNPTVEEVCSVAAAVQNMHLVATAHQVGAYWSTSGIYQKKTFGTQNVSLENPPALRSFLNLKEQDVCLGWMFVGPYGDGKKWPQGRRKPCRVQKR